MSYSRGGHISYPPPLFSVDYKLNLVCCVGSFFWMESISSFRVFLCLGCAF